MILSTRKSPPKDLGKVKRAKTAKKGQDKEKERKKDLGPPKPTYK